MQGKTAAEAAAIEAWEEAGVKGQVSATAVGSYEYMKFLKTGQWERLSVDVFPLEVFSTDDEFPEKGQRICQWFDQHKAAPLVNERALRKLIGGFAP